MADMEQDAQKAKFIVIVDEDLQDLIPGYLENRRKDVEELQGALERSDFEVIRVLGHKMKGSGGGYGFDEISEIGRTLEDAAKQSQAEKIREEIRRLRHYLDHVEVMISS
ncbi:MAG TPA: Hpt domain-containing protein [Smithellaceae bacterium]|nr:Hpt domain-containing protein [Smithellaceae bacterium]HRS82712.1 Hpt domain-containing protein [Smithellaceae bacterium]HRV45463.1 Hpt domain-containing protein [Smithellaceae bacterium]